jgi:hypothetical protein
VQVVGDPDAIAKGEARPVPLASYAVVPLVVTCEGDGRGVALIGGLEVAGQAVQVA